MKRNQRWKLSKGFTMIELMIVIIIIGLLASVGIVQYGRAVANAKNSQAKAVLGEMRKAALAFQSLNGTWPTTTSIIVDLDGDAVPDISFNTPDSDDFTFTSAAGGTGTATKTASAGTGVLNWQINYTNGTFTNP